MDRLGDYMLLSENLGMVENGGIPNSEDCIFLWKGKLGGLLDALRVFNQKLR